MLDLEKRGSEGTGQGVGPTYQPAGKSAVPRTPIPQRQTRRRGLLRLLVDFRNQLRTPQPVAGPQRIFREPAMSNKRSMRALLATGSRLVGGGVRSFEPVIEELISNAESEIQIAAYSFDPSFIPMLARLEQKAKDGVRVTIVLSEIARQHIKVQSALKRMRHATVIDFKASNENSRCTTKLW
jgi:hypothetical protein